MTVLITGGTGFIGSKVARNLLSKDQAVVCMDYAPQLTLFADLGEDPSLSVVKGDTTHMDDIVAVIRDHDIRRIIHLALQEEDGINTESVGRGEDRQVEVLPD